MHNRFIPVESLIAASALPPIESKDYTRAVADEEDASTRKSCGSPLRPAPIVVTIQQSRIAILTFSQNEKYTNFKPDIS